MENGLVLLPHLKYEHIHLTSFSKMHVNLAGQVRLHNIFNIIMTRINIIHSNLQVLSDSVSKALTQYGGKEAEETALFANIFDKFFDCLNVCNFTNMANIAETFFKIHIVQAQTLD